MRREGRGDQSGRDGEHEEGGGQLEGGGALKSGRPLATLQSGSEMAPVEVTRRRDDHDDRRKLDAPGCRLTPPLQMSLDIFGAYPAYFRRSRGEFTVAKDIYVRPRSGWFSDRSVCFLAAGKPVITQETGFSELVPSGEGLLGFANLDEAVAATHAVAADWPRHARAARAIAEEYFGADKVIGAMLEAAKLR